MTKHVVGFSGGIDSQACARWVLNRYPSEDVILINSDAGGNEHPMTTEFIRLYSEQVHPVVCLTPQVQDMGGRAKDKIAELGLTPTDKLTFDLLAKLKKRFPSRMAQFCTYHLKIAPQQRWLSENIADKDDIVRYSGIRRDESASRAKRYQFENFEEYFDCPLILPVFDWTKQMCFDYVRAHGEPINELYTLGFNRVGCAPCINSAKADVLACRLPPQRRGYRLARISRRVAVAGRVGGRWRRKRLAIRSVLFCRGRVPVLNRGESTPASVGRLRTHIGNGNALLRREPPDCVRTNV